MIKYSQLSSTFSYSGKAIMRSGKKKSVVGDPINFRGMAHAPANEAGVVALFSMVARDLGCYIQEIGTDFPDCIVRRDNGRGMGRTGRRIRVGQSQFQGPRP